MKNNVKSNLKTNLSISIIAFMLLSGCSVKPNPIGKEELAQHTKNEMETIDTMMVPVSGKISLDEAIARGVRYNRQKRVAIMEAALSQNQLELMQYDMLADITTNAGYSVRDNYSATASTGFTNGSPDSLGSNPNYSVSQDKINTTADITFSWNVLDFGLSYVRAQQESDKYLIAQEKIKKVTQNITQDIRRAYYQAVASEGLLKNINPIMKEVRAALEDSKRINQLHLESPLNALNYQRELLNILRSLQEVERKLIQSKIELSNLMGLKPGTMYWLAETIKDKHSIPEFSIDFDKMEKIALQKRPELMQSRYQERISEKEIDTALLKVLPGISINAGLNYNDSDYLLNNDWVSYGAKASWNLLNVFKYGSYKKLANSKNDLAKEQKLAMIMAVISQVHLSYVNYAQSIKEYKLSQKYINIADSILKEAEITNRLNTGNKLTLIKEKLNHLLATLRYSSSYADLQNSYGRLYASMGIESDGGMSTVDFAALVPTPEPKEQDIVNIKREELKQELMKELKEELMIDILRKLKAEDKNIVQARNNAIKEVQAEEIKDTPQLVVTEPLAKKEETVQAEEPKEKVVKIVSQPTIVTKPLVENKSEILQSFDSSKPTIEIMKNTELVVTLTADSVSLKEIKKGEKLNFSKKILTEDNSYWYEIVDGGYIQESKARIINK